MSTPVNTSDTVAVSESTATIIPNSAVGKAPKLGWLGVFALSYMAFIYIPVMFLPLFSFNDSIYIAFPLQEFTTRWYFEAFNSPGLIKSLGNSFKIGIPVAIISTILGVLAAKAITRYRMPGKTTVVSFLMAPLVVPGIIVGIGLFVVINAMGIPLSLWTIGFAHLPGCVAFSMWIMISQLEGFDASVEEASLDLGENGWMTFWRITFPLILPGAVASLLLTFTISFDEFILAFFLAGYESTLPIYIYSQMRFPNKLPSVLALGTMILIVSFFLVYFAEWFRRRGARSKPSSGE